MSLGLGASGESGIGSGEYELFNLLHKIEVNLAELSLIRDVARSYVNSLKSCPLNRIIVPPTIMAHFILDALSYSYQTIQETGNSSRRNAFTPSPPSNPSVAVHRRPCDDSLALELALEVLGMRVFISETDHPMLCESIRRQRGELSMTLLLRNRDCLEKLGVILDKLLDSAVHRMYENHSSNGIFFISNKEILSVRAKNPAYTSEASCKDNDEPCCSSTIRRKSSNSSRKSIKENYAEAETIDTGRDLNSTLIEEEFNSITISGESINRQPTQDSSTSSSVTTVVTEAESHEDDSSPRLSELSASSSGISHGQPIFFNDKSGAAQDSMQMPQKTQQQQLSRHSAAQFRFLSNQATEAQAHYMVEFAKRLLTEAGGNQSNTMFNPLHNNAAAAIGINNNQASVGGPHRHLHICSFLIGLYALGLNNQVSSTWPTRTYSTHVSWIQTQALEIGRSALEIVRKTWQAHLTPTEVASLADKASQSADGTVVEEAALLALSVLQKAYALTVVESTKALDQCKEHSCMLLQEACLSVEKAAEKDGVYPEVLFKVANHWFNLHKEVSCSGISTISAVSVQQPNYNIPPPPIHPQYRPQRMLPPPTMMHQMSNDNNGSNAACTSAQTSSSNQQHRLHISHSAPNLQPGIVSASQQPPFLSPLPQQQKPWMTKGQPVGGSSTAQGFPSSTYTAYPPLPTAAQSFRDWSRYVRLPTTPQPTPNQHRAPPPPFYHQQHYDPNYAPAGPPLAHVASTPMNDPQKVFLINAHRVGMRALDTMGLRNSDEGSWSFNKYSKNPNFCNEIRWLFEDVSIKIGVPYVSSFCEKLSDCIASPFLLLHFMKESLKYFQQQQQFNPFQHHQINAMPTFNSPPITASGPSNNPNTQFMCSSGGASQRGASGHQTSAANNCPYSVNQGTAAVTIQLNVVKSIGCQAKNIMLQHLFPHPIAELMRHCVEMSYVAAYNKLNYTRFGESDIDDICELVLVAREAFGMIPQNAGKVMFDTYLRFVRKQKMYKKEVAQKITNCLQN
uniref:Zinc finger SWIM domain-containing protein 8 n=1 Tax=Ditylenchus dipsaci TaxID=166011 RepID=A0A915EH90_9BILA